MSGSVCWGGVLSNQLTMMLQNVEPTANGRGHGGYIHPYTVDYIIMGTSRFWNPVTEICSCLVTKPVMWSSLSQRCELWLRSGSGYSRVGKPFWENLSSYVLFSSKAQSQTMKFKKIWKKMLISSDTTSHIIYRTVISDFFAMLGKNPTSKGEPARTWQQSVLGGTHCCNHITSFSNAEIKCGCMQTPAQQPETERQQVTEAVMSSQGYTSVSTCSCF